MGEKSEKMAVLKVFCFCFTPRKASLVLGCTGIIMSVMMIVPPCLILENHDFYFNEYIRVQKSYADSGVDIRDEDIPAIKYFDKEEEALRSGIERSALALKSRLEQPLMKNDSMDSTETGPTSDSVSACTTQPLDQPLDAIMVSDAHTSGPS